MSAQFPYRGTDKVTIDGIPRQRVLRRRATQEDQPLSSAPVAIWERRYRHAVIASDLFATATAVGVVGIMLGPRLGMLDRISRVLPALGTIVVVLGALAACRAWRSNVLGQGAEEFRRLGRAMLASTLVLALIALATGDVDGRPWIFVVMPTVALLAMPLRYLLRRALHYYRRDGRCLLPVLAAGSVDSVRDLIDRTRRAPHLGWRVEAVCTSGAGGEVAGVPVIGQLDALAEQVRRGGYRIVAVTPDPYWTPNRLRELAWNLEGSETEMVVAPVLMEVAGPRVHVSGVLGMPLLLVSAPAFTGARRVVKGIFDRVAAGVLLTVLSPLILAVALLIKLDSKGPVFYRQQRIGKGEQAFTMLKFRTMGADAESRRAELLPVNQGAGPLFKLRGRPEDHPDRRLAAPLLGRRTPPAGQRARRRHVAGRPASAAARGDPHLRSGHPAQAAGQTGADRVVAGQRAQRSAVGRGDPARPAVRGGLVTRAGRGDPVEDRARGPARQRGVLSDPELVMVGPDPAIGQGGMATVAATLLQHGTAHVDLRAIPTHADGSARAGCAPGRPARCACSACWRCAVPMWCTCTCPSAAAYCASR